MFNNDSRFRHFWSEGELQGTFQRQVAERAFITSLLAITQAAAELTVLYPSDVDLVAAVIKAWPEISNDTLLGRAIWNIRTKGLLGVLAQTIPHVRLITPIPTLIRAGPISRGPRSVPH